MHANLPLALPPSSSTIGTLHGTGRDGSNFLQTAKCAAFRRMHRYQLHVALVVAFSFCFENGAPAEKWKMGAYGQKCRYHRHFA